MLANLVGGRRRPSSAAAATVLVDPSTGDPYDEAPVSTPADLDAAFAAAREGAAAWRRATPAQRSLALLRIAQDLEDRAEELADLECRATGKPRHTVVADELAPVVDHLRFFAGAARTVPGIATGEYVPGHTSSLRREPVGVVAAVTPWNYPLMMAVWKVAPALAAGNAVVLKPAETTPVTPLLLAEIAAEHLPAGVLNVVCGDRGTGRAMVAHPVPAMVALTGSVRAGREVAAAAGLKRTHLELGGKAPVLVLDDADLPRAVAGITRAGYYNAGQSCTAATRVVATPAVHDALVDGLARAATATAVGAPHEGAYHGPLNNPDQLARVAGLVERRSARTEVLAGGSPLARDGFFFPPTVVAGVEQADELAREEVFGPVVTVQRARDEEEALALANDSPYGLAASVWTTDHARALRMQQRIDAGAVWVNCHSVLASEMPHGGWGDSGHGSDLSQLALLEHTRAKHVVSRL